MTFEVCDVAKLRSDQPLDAVFVFDAIHDQVDPVGVLEHIDAALTPGGVFFMKEPHAADALEDNIGNPMAPLMYGCSTLHCMTVSLAHNGAGIGTMFGEQLAVTMLTDAGFTDVQIHPCPGDPGDAMYVSRKRRAQGPTPLILSGRSTGSPAREAGRRTAGTSRLDRDTCARAAAAARWAPPSVSRAVPWTMR